MQKAKITIKGRVAEMGESSNKIDLKLPDSINISKLTAGDKDPMFVTIEVLTPTKSANKVIYKEQDLYSLKDEINSKKPYAYNGHIAEGEESSKNPRAYTQWLYADVIESEGTKKLYAKGYVFKSAKTLREKLIAADAIGKKVPVSIYGKANQNYNSDLDGYEIDDLTLESIDWARDFSQGVASAGSVSITKETKKEKLDNFNMKKLKEMSLEEVKAERADIKEALEDFKKAKTLITEMTQELNVEENRLTETIKETILKNKDLEEQNKKLQEQVTFIEVDTELQARLKIPAVLNIAKRLVLSEMAKGVDRKTAITNVLNSEEIKGLSLSPKLPKNSLETKENDNTSNIKYER